MLGGVALAVALGGCVQATRHSNAVIFGTNTSLGVRVGTDATTVPNITVGYQRQEAVFLPLLANVGETETVTRRQAGQSGETVSQGSLLTPCDPTRPAQIENQRQNRPQDDYLIHPCSFVAVNGRAQDSYSVLASFGARIGASTGSGDEKVQIGIAQYFSTGMAAQMLAITGGASVVSVTAEPPAPANQTLAASLFGTPEERAAAAVIGSEYNSYQAMLETTLAGLAAATYITKLQKFEDDIGATGRPLSGYCLVNELDPSGCSAYLNSDEGDGMFLRVFNGTDADKAKFNSALAALAS
jgi:hypothetical protein